MALIDQLDQTCLPNALATELTVVGEAERTGGYATTTLRGAGSPDPLSSR